MGTKQVEEKNASQLNLTKAAEEQVQQIILGKTNYTELWYGSQTNMQKNFSELEKFFKDQNITLTQTKKTDPRDNREYFVIQIRRTESEEGKASASPVPKKEIENEPVQVTLSTAAQREVDKIINGSERYRELWYGTDGSRDEAIQILEKMFKEDGMNISISRNLKEQDGKTFYVISLMNKDTVAQRTQETREQENVEEKAGELITQTKQTERELTKHKNLTKVFGEKVADSLMKWGEHHNVDPYVLASIIVAEHSSNNDKNRTELVGRRLRNNPNAYSKKVSPESISSELSYGLGQFVKPTLEKVLEKPDTFESVIADYDKSIKYMGKFISAIQRANKLTSREEIAFAYNAGPTTLNNLKKEGGDWQENLEGKIRPGLRGTFFTGKNYIKKVNEAYKELNSA